MEMMTHILIVEDEDSLAQLLEDYLRADGFIPHRLAAGDQVVEWVRRNHPDLVLLDLMLPGLDGMSVCRQLRTFTSVPIIITTARVEEIDRLLGLELGADDYICKPYSPREVVARVKAVLRRATPEGVESDSGLKLDPQRYVATIDGIDIGLTAVEFQLLTMLARQPGRLFSRNQLMEGVYRDQRIVAERTIDSHIKKLRKKIAAVKPDGELIQSVYGVGYKFEE